jgi:hypothetical protein
MFCVAGRKKTSSYFSKQHYQAGLCNEQLTRSLRGIKLNFPYSEIRCYIKSTLQSAKTKDVL